ncbi:hypothetical protein FPV67DRAFT_1474575 [Lyophyllum atratum]|nr:hypothetical protein FPV67DRAFT_1474568 [Lyophyllum atratum]KAF8074689.1 hypothetical protein FPV67DRAFT_1474575 [Lyophyllum atratum]
MMDHQSSLPPSSPPSPLTSLPSSPTLQPACAPSTPLPRAQSLPPFSSDGLEMLKITPIVGTKAQRAALIRQESVRKRLGTLQTQREEAEAARLRLEEEEGARIAARALEKSTFFDETLSSLKRHGYTVGEFLLYLSNPMYKQRQARWEGLFRDRTTVPQLLNLWASQSTPASREQVHDWAVEYVAKEVRYEARQITFDQKLQTSQRPIDLQFVLGFEMGAVQSYLRQKGSAFMRILESFATSTRQLKTASPARFAKKLNVVTWSALALLGEYSYSNNWAKKVMGLYLYSSGIQKQALSVMTHIGVAESYDSIIRQKRRRKKKTLEEPTTPTPNAHATASPALDNLANMTAEEMYDVMYDVKGGTLRQLSASMVDVARVIASTGLFACSYDNINMVFRAAEQIVGRTDAQENGTCATIWPLFKAAVADMQVSDLEAAFTAAAPLAIHDVVLNPVESAQLRTNLTHCILRIIIAHGGDGFNKFVKYVDRTLPCSEHKIELHKTPLHPLPAFDIDESTIIGGAEVVDAVFDVLWIKKIKDWLCIVKIFCGDQLTVARLRSLVNIRAGHEGGYTGFGWGVWMPGLFHAKMADVHGFFVTHFGKAAAGPRNPGSLSFHNTVLQRKPIVLTSLPPFRTCRDLIFVSLYARVLQCFLLISKSGTLEEYSEGLTWAQLERDAHTLIDIYANADTVAELRRRREIARQNVKPGEPIPRDGDMVYENAILFLRDALLSREFTDAVKAGDSGRIVLILKIWALSFRGNGRTKYAHEMLHLIHNITSVWPKSIREIVLNNWLVNPTGNPNSWVEVDLMQEHMNFWIKNFYRAHGSAASWEWLAMIAPCVNILRQLAQNFKKMLGTNLGTDHHPMDLSLDIPDIMDSLDEYEVYEYKKGRYLDDDDPPAPDVTTTGLTDLISGPNSPLSDYRKAFNHLQARRRLRPLVIGEEMSNKANSYSTPAETLLDTNDVDHLPESRALAQDEADIDDDDIDDPRDEELGEFLRGFEDDEDETLALESAADVSLDMDAEDMAGYLNGDEESELGSDEDEDDSVFEFDM